MTRWPASALCGFDLETTGPNPQTDRIVSACVVHSGPIRTDLQVTTWLADPGIAIPDAATAVHGISTRRARAEGRPAADVVAELVAALAGAANIGTPIVIMNAPFDLTILEREADRYGIKSLFSRSVPYVIDPRVLDKQVDRYRRGRRRLEDLCRVYGVNLKGAHTANGDALAAVRVARRIGLFHPKIGDTDPAELHKQQAAWAREQNESFARYLRNTPGREHEADAVSTEWPLIPAQREGGDAS
ncbi:exonuclease domain-containing protein [Streptomyces sp. NPDC046900]|uniref:exonuclease domain-containing protein n=1 Tax=Streptomyces sp. NPDC046900 TaxID=3155473 RepID=UPI0033DD639A